MLAEMMQLRGVGTHVGQQPMEYNSACDGPTTGFLLGSRPDGGGRRPVIGRVFLSRTRGFAGLLAGRIEPLVRSWSSVNGWQLAAAWECLAQDCLVELFERFELRNSHLHGEVSIAT